MRSRLSTDDSPGLEHHRLLWESPIEAGPGAPPRSEVRIFEHVRGATVEGSAPKGASVHATLRYVSNRRRNGVFETATDADESGRSRMRLPYATRGAPPGISTETAYVVRSGGDAETLVVDELAVAEGLPVSGPSFTAE
jgi:dolichyl-diphosphooligosaccharide--protein glycosyltransferase